MKDVPSARTATCSTTSGSCDGAAGTLTGRARLYQQHRLALSVRDALVPQGCGPRQHGEGQAGHRAVAGVDPVVDVDGTQVRVGRRQLRVQIARRVASTYSTRPLPLVLGPTRQWPAQPDAGRRAATSDQLRFADRHQAQADDAGRLVRELDDRRPVEEPGARDDVEQPVSDEAHGRRQEHLVAAPRRRAPTAAAGAAATMSLPSSMNSTDVRAGMHDVAAGPRHRNGDPALRGRVDGIDDVDAVQVLVDARAGAPRRWRSSRCRRTRATATVP